MNFYFAREGEIGADGKLRLPRDDRWTRLSRAVDLHEGAAFRIAAEGRGRGTAVVLSIDERGLEADFLPADTQPVALSIDLVLAMPRPKVLKRIVPAIASMGVRSLTLVNACGVHRDYFDSHWTRSEQVTSLMLLGLEQSGVCRIPRVLIKKELKPFVEDELGGPLDSETRLIALPGERPVVLNAGTKQAVVLSIGPETGWTDFEVDLFKDAGFLAHGIGEEHLASDVAAMALIGAVKGMLLA